MLDRLAQVVKRHVDIVLDLRDRRIGPEVETDLVATPATGVGEQVDE